MNNIAIKLEQINIDKDTKEEINKFAKTYRMKVTYYYGCISKFDKSNVHTITQHKIIFSKYMDMIYWCYIMMNIIKIIIYILYQTKKNHLQYFLAAFVTPFFKANSHNLFLNLISSVIIFIDTTLSV